MIQRVQSIYLLIASIIMSLLFLKSIVLVKISGTIPEQRKSLAYFGDEILDIYDHSVLIILTSLIVLISLVTIFLFRNRKLQILLSRIAMLISFVFLILSIYLAYTDLQPYIESLRIAPALGIFIPFITIILLILSVQGIKKDEKLVRSMDRLR